MEIRFISSLTPEDENRFGAALFAAVVQLLDQLPLAYTIRVANVSGKVFQHSHPPAGDQREESPRPVAARRTPSVGPVSPVSPVSVEVQVSGD